MHTQVLLELNTFNVLICQAVGASVCFLSKVVDMATGSSRQGAHCAQYSCSNTKAMDGTSARATACCLFVSCCARPGPCLVAKCVNVVCSVVVA